MTSRQRAAIHDQLINRYMEASNTWHELIEHANNLHRYMEASNTWHELIEHANNLRSWNESSNLNLYESSTFSIKVLEGLNYFVEVAWKEVERSLSALEAFNADTHTERH